MPKNLGQPSKLDKRVTQKSGALDAKLTPQQIQDQIDALDAAHTTQSRIADRDAAIESPKTSFGEQILSPEGLIKLGLAVAGGLSGNQSLQAAGLGLASGTIEGASQWANQDNDARTKQIDDLSKMVEKQQQRLITLLQSQPGLFVDGKGKNLVEPADWSAILESGVPIDVAALIGRQGSGSGGNALAKSANDIIGRGIQMKNPVVVKQGMRMFSAANGLDWDEDYIETLSRVTPENFMDVLLQNHTANSVSELVQTANSLGVPVFDPQLQGILIEKPTGAAPTTPIDELAFEGLDKLDAWLQTDNNQAKWEINKYDALEEAFEQEPRYLAALKKQFPWFNRGDKFAEMRLQTELDLWKDADKTIGLMKGALTTDPAEKRRLMAQLSADKTRLFESASNMKTLAANKNSAMVLGTAYTARNRMDPSLSSHIGSLIVTRSNAMMRADGIDPISVSQTVRDEYIAQATAMIDAQFKPEDDTPEGE